MVPGGAHRRQRSSLRPGRGAIWTGLFLLLSTVAVLASRNLWPGVAENLLGLGPPSPPQASIVWQAETLADAMCSVNAAGDVLLASPGGKAADGGATRPTAVGLASAGKTTLLFTSPASLLAAAFYCPVAVETPEGMTRTSSDWRVILAGGAGKAGGETSGSSGVESGVATGRASSEPGDTAGSNSSDGSGEGGFLIEEALAVEPGGQPVPVFRAKGSVITAAAAWADGASLLLGLYAPAVAGDAEGRVIAVGSSGEELWSHAVGTSPVHRLATRPGTGFVAATTPNSVTLFDSHGNLLWTRTLRAGIIAVAVQSHGGPAVIADGKLWVYDRRGNLVWRKQAASPMTSLATGGNRIAVAAGREVIAYDEDGLERWSLTCAATPTALSLDPEAVTVAAVLDSGRVIVARVPGGTGP